MSKLDIKASIDTQDAIKELERFIKEYKDTFKNLDDNFNFKAGLAELNNMRESIEDLQSTRLKLEEEIAGRQKINNDYMLKANEYAAKYNMSLKDVLNTFTDIKSNGAFLTYNEFLAGGNKHMLDLQQEARATDQAIADMAENISSISTENIMREQVQSTEQLKQSFYEMNGLMGVSVGQLNTFGNGMIYTTENMNAAVIKSKETLIGLQVELKKLMETGGSPTAIEDLSRIIEELETVTRETIEATADNLGSGVSPQINAATSRLNDFITTTKNAAQELRNVEGLEGAAVEPPEEARSKWDTFYGSIKNGAEGAKEGFAKIVDGTKKVASGVVKVTAVVSKGFKSIGDFTKKTAASFTQVGKGLKESASSITRTMLAVVGVRSIFTGISRAMNVYNQQTEQGVRNQAMLNEMWLKLGTIIAPVVNFITEGFARVLQSVINILAMFGITAKASKKVQDGLGGSVDNAKKLNKEMRQLASFDDMNVMQSDKETSGSGGGGAGSTITPDVDVKGFKKFENFVKNIFKKLKKDLDPFLKTIKSINFDPIKESVKGLGEVFKTSFGIIYDSAIRTMNNAVGPFLKAFTEDYAPKALDKIAAGIDYLNPILERFLIEVVEPFFAWFMREIAPRGIELISAAVEFLIVVFGSLLDIITEFYLNNKELFDYLGGIALQVIDWVIGKLEKWTEELKAGDNSILKTVRNLVILIGTLKLFGSMFTFAFFKAPGIILNIANAIDKMDDAWLLIKPTVEAVGASISSLGLWIIPIIIAIIGAVWGLIKHFDKIKEVVSNVFDSAKQVLQGFIDFFVAIFTGDVDKAVEALKNIFKNYFEYLVNYVVMVVTIAGAMLDGIKDVVVKILSAIFTAIEAVFIAIGDAISSFGSKVKNAVTNAIDGVKNMFSNFKNWIMDLFGKIKIPNPFSKWKTPKGSGTVDGFPAPASAPAPASYTPFNFAMPTFTPPPLMMAGAYTAPVTTNEVGMGSRSANRAAVASQAANIRDSIGSFVGSFTNNAQSDIIPIELNIENTMTLDGKVIATSVNKINEQAKFRNNGR